MQLEGKLRFKYRVYDGLQQRCTSDTDSAIPHKKELFPPNTIKSDNYIFCNKIVSLVTAGMSTRHLNQNINIPRRIGDTWF